MAAAKKVSRHISRALQDFVWQRAHGKCQYISPEGERGEKAYDPRLMLKVLFYGYSTGTFSSHKIAKRVEEDVALVEKRPRRHENLDRRPRP